MGSREGCFKMKNISACLNADRNEPVKEGKWMIPDRGENCWRDTG